MKRQSRLLVSTCSSSINNYDAHELATRLNESVCKTADEACKELFHKEIEDHVIAKITAQFNNEWVEKEAVLKNEWAQEKATRECDKKVKSKLDKLWNFFKIQQTGSSTASLGTAPSNEDYEDEHEDADEDEETVNMADDSHE